MVGEREDLTDEFIEQNLDNQSFINGLSRNKNPPSHIIKKYPEKDWDWASLLYTLEPEFIIENKDLFQCEWHEFGSNQKITIDFIEKHIDMFEEWFSVYVRWNVTPEFIDK